jgi:hypothetical protein
MSSTGTARSELERFYQADAKVTVKDGIPSPLTVNVKLLGTVQFINTDKVAYKVRLWGPTQEHHADVDILLPARGSFTLIVDPGTIESGRCEYDLFPTDLSNLADPVRLTSAVVDVVEDVTEVMEVNIAPGRPAPGMPPSGSSPSAPTEDNRGGGGTIIIGG